MCRFWAWMVFVAVSWCGSLTRADAGPLEVYFAGDVSPGRDTQVEMVGEVVEFSNFKYDESGYYSAMDVKASFTLKNTGPENERVAMFFPFR